MKFKKMKFKIGSLEIKNFSDVKKGLGIVREAIKKDGYKGSVKKVTDYRKQINNQKQYKKRQDLGEVGYRERSFPEYIERALAQEDLFLKIRDLHVVHRRIEEYLLSIQPPRPKGNRVTGTVRASFRKKRPQEAKSHIEKMHDLQDKICRVVDELVEKNVEAIAKNPDRVWILSKQRVAEKFAMEAKKQGVKLSPEEEKYLSPVNNNKKPKL